LVFAALVGTLGAITQLFFIAPLIEQQKMLAAQIDKKSSAMDLQREELNIEMLKRGRDRLAELNANTLRIQADLVEVEREIKTLSGKGNDAAMTSTMLKRVLRRSDKVTLVRVSQSGTETGAGLAASGRVARSGLDITLSGSYLDLMEYLASLETALPAARWGALWLRAESSPAQLTLHIVTAPPE
jgi:MSHA biogenesis protein MshJ